MGIFPKFRDENKTCLKPPRSFGLACVFWNQYVAIYKTNTYTLLKLTGSPWKKMSFNSRESNPDPSFNSFLPLPLGLFAAKMSFVSGKINIQPLHFSRCQKIKNPTEASIHPTFAQSPHQNQVLVKHHDLANLGASPQTPPRGVDGGKGATTWDVLLDGS